MATQFDRIKLWIFPGLVSIIGIMVLNAVTEIKTDIKFLLSQGTADHIRIDNLERVVYAKTLALLEEGQSTPPKENPPKSQEMMATIPPANRFGIKQTAKKKRP
jgi:hypothetical protein